MKTSEWTPPALGGALIGAIAVAALGFGVGGWMTGTSVDKLVRAETQATLVSIMLPICLNQANGDPERVPKMARLQSASAWSRDDVVTANGWATMPGSEEPARGVAQACAESLIKAASTD